MGDDKEVNFDDTNVIDSGSDDSVAKPRESIYRRSLRRIATDGSLSKRHSVPDLAAPPKNPAWYTRDGVKSYEQSLREMTAYDWLEVVFPVTKLLKNYNWRVAGPKDFIAGLTVGFMVVPQSLSYAKLAGLPVQYGLYSTLVPTYVYAFFGTSRQLAVGPVALVSLVVGTSITKLLAKRGIKSSNKKVYTAAFVTAAIQTSFIVGLIYLFLGLLRLGFITILLSHAVVSGFISASAIIIGSSQLKYFFGYNIPQTEKLHEICHYLVKDLKNFNWRTFLVGIFALALLIFMKQIGNYVPKLKYLRVLGPLTVSVIGILIDVAIRFSHHGIPTVGHIPEGLPDSTVHLWTPLHGFKELVPTILTVALVGFMESIAIAKKMAAQHQYPINSSSEFIGLGLSNFLGSMAGAYPVTGSFSRSAVNNDTGAQTQLSGIVTATIILFVLLFLTPVFQRVPQAILGSIVISAVIGLLDYQEFINLWRIDKFDFAVWNVSFFCTLFAGVEVGLLVAVAVSLVLVIYESAYPHTAVLGRLPGTSVYRNVKQYPDAETFEGILLVRVDAPIYFANTQNIRDKLAKYEEISHNDKNPVKYLILELSPVSHIDSSAVHILKDMVDNYNNRDVQLCFSNPSAVVMERLVTSGLADLVGREHIFVTVHDGVNYCLTQLDIAESEHGIVKDVEAVDEQASD